MLNAKGCMAEQLLSQHDKSDTEESERCQWDFNFLLLAILSSSVIIKYRVMSSL